MDKNLKVKSCLKLFFPDDYKIWTDSSTEHSPPSMKRECIYTIIVVIQFYCYPSPLSLTLGKNNKNNKEKKTYQTF